VEQQLLKTRKRLIKIKLSLQLYFAKNFYDFTFKAGLIENTGGVGMEYHIIPKRMKFIFDAFDFGEDAPHLRAALRYTLFHGIYLIGGADDFISDDGDESGYIGAGIDLSNDDLKLFLSIFRPTAAVLTISILIAVFLPKSKDLYIIYGANVVEDVVKSLKVQETGGKVLDLINKKLSELSEK
jgi:hypothetical protein